MPRASTAAQRDSCGAAVGTSSAGRCVGGFLSGPSWLVALVMMALGYVLRHGGWSHGTIGVVYAVVGTALVLASRRFWRAWRQTRLG